MGLNFKQFHNLVLVPTLRPLNVEVPYTDKARVLVMETLWHESGGLRYLAQWPNNGPGVGLCMYERPTWDWISTKYERVLRDLFGYQEFGGLALNLGLCVAMCRLRYAVVSEPIPELSQGVQARGSYWGKYYQTTNDPAKNQLYVAHAADIPWANNQWEV